MLNDENYSSVHRLFRNQTTERMSRLIRHLFQQHS